MEMKPRAEAPLTDEDCGIWLVVTLRLYALAGSPKSLPISFLPGCDRRDADLMLQLAVSFDLVDTEDGPWDIANWVLDREGLRHP
jgi:hypothetical protein